MARRKRMSMSRSRRDFRKKSGTHPKNVPGMAVMRGGYRL